MCLSTSSDAAEQLEISSFALKRGFKPITTEQAQKSFDYQSSFSLSDSETQLSQEDIDIPQLNPKIDIFDLDILDNLSSHGGVEAPYTIQNEKSTQQDGDTLDWSEYKPNKEIFRRRNHFSALCDGILSFIKKNADQKKKIEYEIWYEFSSVLKPHVFNPFSLMDPNDTNSYTSAFSKGQYVKFSLKRVAVCPTAYFLMSDNKIKIPKLRSFVFQARLYPEYSEWETLDERFEINSLTKLGGYSIFYVDTDKYYNEFRVVQTAPMPVHNFYGFSLSFFEIHGDVKIYQRTKAVQDLSIYF